MLRVNSSDLCPRRSAAERFTGLAIDGKAKAPRRHPKAPQPLQVLRWVFGHGWEAQMAAEGEFPPFLIAAPRCPKCSTQTMLARVSLERPGYDQYFYECPKCEHEVLEVDQFRKAG